MSIISKLKSLWERLSDREYREAYLDELVNSRLSAQIYALRISRGLTQAEVAGRTGIAQPTLSRLEADAQGVTTSTLKRLANAYEVALSVKFVSYKEFSEDIAAGGVDRYVPSFAQDVGPTAMAIAAMITAPSTYRKPITVSSEETALVERRLAKTIKMTKAVEDQAYVRAS